MVRKIVVGLLLTAAQIAVPLSLARTPQRPDRSEAPPAQHARPTHSRGPANAPIRIIEFSNFACPSCKKARGDLKELLASHGDRISYTFRHFPKFSDSRSVKAHVAAECASKQAAFWPYYDKLFSEQTAWHSPQAPESILTSYARELGLDVEEFEACLHDDAVFDRVLNECDEGESLGGTHTPTFLIQDRFFAGRAQLRKQGIPFIKKLLEESG